MHDYWPAGLRGSMDDMADSGRTSDQRWVLWFFAGLSAVLWISLVGVIRPSGVLEVTAMVIIGLVAALCAGLIVLGSSGGGTAVRVRANRRK